MDIISKRGVHIKQFNEHLDGVPTAQIHEQSGDAPTLQSHEHTGGVHTAQFHENLAALKFPRFFVATELEVGGRAAISGGDAAHITAVLRMRTGEKAVLCGIDGFDYPSEIVAASKTCVEFHVLQKRENTAEPALYLRLFQCLPKGDKLDLIVQKATELGVSEIIPVVSKRCVSRPKSDNSGKSSGKIARLQKIAEQAAKQSGRGKIPKVHEFTDFCTAITLFNSENLGIIFYENLVESVRINEILANRGYFTNADIFIGSEGGFEPREVELAEKAGFVPASLGKLILRTETAPIAAISILMNLTGYI
ncbi:MAG: 16S rRNA (uracil(1498)-N(3))-methyltransferase [Oscillospiraceae bacterium]|nr:16S rRNA (uracil(1498)-N(3))-methyltransferase [Oscillospiraceae bacterium]